MNPIFKVQNGKQIDIHMQMNTEQGPREITIVSDIKIESYAEFIVRACNCHEELVDCLKTLLDLIDKNVLVRNIKEDADFGKYVSQSTTLVLGLKAAYEALSQAKEV